MKTLSRTVHAALPVASGPRSTGLGVLLIADAALSFALVVILGAAIARVAEYELVIPSRPHSIRAPLESALAAESRRAKIGLEIESVPAILDLVQRDDLHAVLALNAIKSSGNEAAFRARPIGRPRLVTTLWIATSTQRPRGPLLERASELLRELLVEVWKG